jgi:hypothetical protein
MMDWFPAVMTLVGVLIGVGIQEFRIWRERKDKYKDMVFEKRLDVHQGAYYWCMKFVKLMMPHRLMKVVGREALLQASWEFTEWLNKNALYLDEGSVEKLNKFFQYVTETGCKYADEKRKKDINIKEETQELIKNVNDILASIKKGIGFKYLPEQEILIEGIESEKLLDKAVEMMGGLIRKKEE